MSDYICISCREDLEPRLKLRLSEMRESGEASEMCDESELMKNLYEEAVSECLAAVAAKTFTIPTKRSEAYSSAFLFDPQI